MADHMNIVTGGKWTRKKTGTIVFDDQQQFIVTPQGETPRTYPLQALQSVQWEPNGLDDRMLRNPAITFIVCLLLAIVISFVLFLLKGRGWSLGGMLGFCAVVSLSVAFTKAHRARFRFTNGDSVLVAISRSFAKKMGALKPGVGPN